MRLVNKSLYLCQDFSGSSKLLMLKRSLIALLLFALWFLSPPAFAADQGAALFEVQCAGCHPKGGNIIRRGKTLQLKALQRNHRDSLESIVDIVSNGKGNMSAYKDRLSQAEIETLATYVLEQAEKGWRN